MHSKKILEFHVEYNISPRKHNDMPSHRQEKDVPMKTNPHWFMSHDTDHGCMSQENRLYTKTEQEDTCVFSGFFVVFNEVIDNWGWYNIPYVLCIFMLKRLKSYTNAFTLVIKSRPPEFPEFIAASICS